MYEQQSRLLDRAIDELTSMPCPSDADADMFPHQQHVAAQLRDMFPHVTRERIHDVLAYCDVDMDKAIAVLLEGRPVRAPQRKVRCFIRVSSILFPSLIISRRRPQS